MKLSKICEKIKYECLQGSMDAEVRDIIYDSRKIAKETMFVCMVGAVTDGHKYIPDAVEKGASVIVVERDEEAAQIPDTITVLKVESARYALALMSAALFDYPAEKTDYDRTDRYKRKDNHNIHDQKMCWKRLAKKLDLSERSVQ